MEISQKVLKTISTYNMIKKGDNVLVAFSGGADSVALLLLLEELKETLMISQIMACHINHNLRETAKRDELFCEEFCKSRNIAFYKQNFNIRDLKSDLKSSEEDVARQKRYETFLKLKEQHSISRIATAHHKNDVVENYFIRLFRGSSLDGLTLIKPCREDGVIRPLIAISKEEIYEYLSSKNQEYVVDETNFSDIYLRNDIRLNFIPYLKEKFNPEIEKVIFNTAKLNYDDSLYINQQADEKFKQIAKVLQDKIKFLTRDLYNLPPSILGRIIIKAYYKLTKEKLLSSHIESVLNLIENNITGKRIFLKNNIICYIDYNYFVMGTPVEFESFEYKLNMGENYIKEIDKTFIVSLSDGVPIPMEFLPHLAIRNRRTGDKIFIEEINGTKKIKDIFIDKKISRDKRDLIPIITYNDEIIGIHGIYYKKFKQKDIIYIKGV